MYKNELWSTVWKTLFKRTFLGIHSATMWNWGDQVTFNGQQDRIFTVYIILIICPSFQEEFAICSEKSAHVEVNADPFLFRFQRDWCFRSLKSRIKEFHKNAYVIATRKIWRLSGRPFFVIFTSCRGALFFEDNLFILSIVKLLFF